MTDPSLQKLWDQVKHHLNQGFSLLPQNPRDNDDGGRVNSFHEYVNANELELALDELEGLGKANQVTNEFWKELFEAANLMGLDKHKDRYVKK